MINLFDSNITDIMPEYFAYDPKVQALGYALQRANKRLIDYCENIGLYSVIDTLPEEMVDALAVDLDTQYYDTTLDLQAKRDLVKGTLAWYEKAGTPQAISELIAAVFGEGEVKEWFEYGGSPYYFKIVTSAQLTPDIDSEFTKIIKKVKNARSHVEAIEINRQITQTTYIGIGRNIMIKPPAIVEKLDKKNELLGIEYTGVGGVQNTKAQVIEENLQYDSTINQTIYAAPGYISNSKNIIKEE